MFTDLGNSDIVCTKSVPWANNGEELRPNVSFQEHLNECFLISCFHRAFLESITFSRFGLKVRCGGGLELSKLEKTLSNLM